METVLLIVLIVIACLLFWIGFILTKLVQNHCATEVEKIRIHTNIGGNLDRIGSIMRENQSRRSART